MEKDSGLKSLDVFHHPAFNACHSSSLPTPAAKHSPGSSRHRAEGKAELLRAGLQLSASRGNIPLQEGDAEIVVLPASASS